MPAAAVRAWSFLRAVIRLVLRDRGRLLRNGRIARRWEICRDCEHFANTRCRLCGCRISTVRSLGNKLAHPGQRCPARPPHWKELS